MTASSWWLALDQGGHASRAIVFDATGQLLTQTVAPIQTHHDGLRVEHDAAALLQSLQHCLDELAQQLGADIQRIAAAGLATQRSSIVCWQRQTGLPLSPVLSWQDRRQHEWLTQFEPQRERIQSLTGLVLSPHYGASKLRWCLDHLPAVRDAHANNTLAMGPLSSYLLQGLLLERPQVVDPANASRTLLWSPASRDWVADLLTLFGVPREVLPRCVPTRHPFGHLELMHRDIRVHIPLRICTGDQAAVPYANGPLDTHCIYVNAGTGAFALLPMTTDIPHAAPLLRSTLWSDATTQVQALEGTVNGAGAALSWYAAQQHLTMDTEVAPVLRSLNRHTVGTTSLPLFINGIGGIGSPFWLPHIDSRFVGAADPLADPQHQHRQHIAAIIESIAFLLAANLIRMQQHVAVQRVLIGGGLGQCDYLCECVADLINLPVQRLAERELTAKGLAFLVADQPRLWQHESVTPSSSAAQNQFLPQANAALMTRQQRWQQLVSSPALAPLPGK